MKKCAKLWTKENRDGRVWTSQDVSDWRTKNHYTWHECNDRKTCQLVPTKVNLEFKHLGGCAECKLREAVILEASSMGRKLAVWGREFNLQVGYDARGGAEVTDAQKDTLENFLEKAPELLEDPAPVKKYLKKRDPDHIKEEIDNIFYYVIPKRIFVEQRKGVVDLMCDYRYDLEDGLALVFENGKLKRNCAEIEIG
jgi:hypothetical protein